MAKKFCLFLLSRCVENRVHTSPTRTLETPSPTNSHFINQLNTSADVRPVFQLSRRFVGRKSGGLVGLWHTGRTNFWSRVRPRLTAVVFFYEPRSPNRFSWDYQRTAQKPSLIFSLPYIHLLSGTRNFVRLAKCGDMSNRIRPFVSPHFSISRAHFFPSWFSLCFTKHGGRQRQRPGFCWWPQH